MKEINCERKYKTVGFYNYPVLTRKQKRVLKAMLNGEWTTHLYKVASIHLFNGYSIPKQYLWITHYRAILLNAANQAHEINSNKNVTFLNERVLATSDWIVANWKDC